MMEWQRTGRYSMRIVGAPYAVSMAQAINRDIGVLGKQFSAWHGEPMHVGPHHAPFPELLGVERTVAAAKALCERHALASLMGGR